MPVSEVAGKELDGCFIGACMTVEEDLIIGAMVLEEALKQGSKQVRSGKRLVVPGSKPIRHKIEKLGLMEVYERDGFAVGVPGCSMCVGQGMDQAGEEEVWLSFQLSGMEKQLIAAGGITEAFGRFGKKLFDVMCAIKEPRRGPARKEVEDMESL